MTAKATDDPLILARSLTRHAEQLCNGLESGTVDLYDLVTPTTAQLLHWWFGEDACQTRAFNFHPGQRQAILNRSEEHTSELQSLMRISYAVFCLHKKKKSKQPTTI